MCPAPSLPTRWVGDWPEPEEILSDSVSAGMDAPHLQDQLVALLTESRAVALQRFDDETASAILQRVVPEFSRFLERGRRVLGEIEEACTSEEDPAASWAFPERLEELATVCFFVEGEWKRALAGLERLTDATPGWTCLAQIERARDRLVRGILAVERDYAVIAGSAPRTDPADLLHEALEARRVITLFRRDIFGAPRARPQSEDLDRRLRHAKSALERLIEREEFGLLRVADRHLARGLQRRINAWPEGRGSAEGEAGAWEGLWQDVVNFAVLLWDVNRRIEIVEEDLAVIGEAQLALEPSAPRKLLPASVAALLRALFGRDDELDGLLEATAESDRVLERLREVQESLARERAPRPGPEWSPAGPDDSG